MIKKHILNFNVKVLIFLFFAISFGCTQIPKLDNWAMGWIGRPFEELLAVVSRPTSYASRIGWTKKEYTLSNGNLGFDEPIRKGCIVQWEINSENIIVSYRKKGERCW
jgi:hypothetical protein